MAAKATAEEAPPYEPTAWEYSSSDLSARYGLDAPRDGRLETYRRGRPIYNLVHTSRFGADSYTPKNTRNLVAVHRLAFNTVLSGAGTCVQITGDTIYRA